jgi:hypothetical protein
MAGMEDFFLVSSEGFRWGEPRRCSFIRRLRDKRRNDLMLVSIDPPIIGQQCGLGARDVDVIILASRLEGYSLFPISDWPCPVYCGRIIGDGPDQKGFIAAKSYEIIDWAAIWQTED